MSRFVDELHIYHHDIPNCLSYMLHLLCILLHPSFGWINWITKDVRKPPLLDSWCPKSIQILIWGYFWEPAIKMICNYPVCIRDQILTKIHLNYRYDVQISALSWVTFPHFWWPRSRSPAVAGPPPGVMPPWRYAPALLPSRSLRPCYLDYPMIKRWVRGCSLGTH